MRRFPQFVAKGLPERYYASMATVALPSAAFSRDAPLTGRPFPFEMLHTDGPAQNMKRFHWHEYVEISYVRDGSGRYEVEESVFDVQPGDFVIIRSNERHRVTYSPKDTLYETVMHFERSLICASEDDRFNSRDLDLFLATPSADFHRIRARDEENQRLARLLTDIQAEYRRKPSLYDMMIKSKLLTLVTLLMRHSGMETTVNPHESARQRETVRRLDRITGFIRQSSASDISLTDVAAQFSMNASYFSSYFHKHLGVTFSEFLAQVRVEDAIPLLRAGRMRVIDIAYECGFNTPASFYRAFRTVTGTTPRAYIGKGSS